MDECGHSKARCRVILSSEGEWRVEGMSQERFLELFPNIEVSVSEGEIRVRNLYAQVACQDSGHPSGDRQFVLSSSLVGKGVLSVEPGKSSQVTGWRVLYNGGDEATFSTSLSGEAFLAKEPPTLLQTLQALTPKAKRITIRAPFSDACLSQIEALAQSDLEIAIGGIEFFLAVDAPLPDPSRIGALLPRLADDGNSITFYKGGWQFWIEKSGQARLEIDLHWMKAYAHLLGTVAQEAERIAAGVRWMMEPQLSIHRFEWIFLPTEAERNALFEGALFETQWTLLHMFLSLRSALGEQSLNFSAYDDFIVEFGLYRIRNGLLDLERPDIDREWPLYFAALVAIFADLIVGGVVGKKNSLIANLAAAISSYVKTERIVAFERFDGWGMPALASVTHLLSGVHDIVLDIEAVRRRFIVIDSPGNAEGPSYLVPVTQERGRSFERIVVCRESPDLFRAIVGPNTIIERYYDMGPYDDPINIRAIFHAKALLSLGAKEVRMIGPYAKESGFHYVATTTPSGESLLEMGSAEIITGIDQFDRIHASAFTFGDKRLLIKDNVGVFRDLREIRFLSRAKVDHVDMSEILGKERPNVEWDMGDRVVEFVESLPPRISLSIPSQENWWGDALFWARQKYALNREILCEDFDAHYLSPTPSLYYRFSLANGHAAKYAKSDPAFREDSIVARWGELHRQLLEYLAQKIPVAVMSEALLRGEWTVHPGEYYLLADLDGTRYRKEHGDHSDYGGRVSYRNFRLSTTPGESVPSRAQVVSHFKEGIDRLLGLTVARFSVGEDFELTEIVESTEEGVAIGEEYRFVIDCPEGRAASGSEPIEAGGEVLPQGAVVKYDVAVEGDEAVITYAVYDKDPDLYPDAVEITEQFSTLSIGNGYLHKEML